MKLQREEWYGKFHDVKLDQLVFLDEFGATTNMTRRYARGPKGQRIVCKTPHGHWKLLSTIAALTSDGMLCGATFDGATDTVAFVLFVENFLAPHLKPGQVLVMDNLPAHKSPRVDELVEARGARVLRLPPYSPDFNPIEMAISKIKTLLRSLEQRTVPTLRQAIGTALASITAQDAINYIQHCRYADTNG